MDKIRPTYERLAQFKRKNNSHLERHTLLQFIVINALGVRKPLYQVLTYVCGNETILKVF